MDTTLIIDPQNQGGFVDQGQGQGLILDLGGGADPTLQGQLEVQLPQSGMEEGIYVTSEEPEDRDNALRSGTFSQASVDDPSMDLKGPDPGAVPEVPTGGDGKEQWEPAVQREVDQNQSLAGTYPLVENANCTKCGVVLEAGEVGVVAPKISDLQCWHPSCFVCTTCDEMLVDLVYCHLDGAIYCERHYAELIKPRCAACDELIFSGEYTKAMEQDWHSTHFCCFNCDLNLTGHRYILRDEHPYCIKCYENLFANSCEECKTPIGTDSKDLSYKEKHWHEKCFKCSDCQNSLVDQPFASKNEKLFCADCHDNNFAARCDGCQNIFRAGMKKYEYKGKQWHEQCFCCKVCQQPIGNKSFIPRDQEVVCVPCYEEQYAQRCMKCNGVINKGGITYKGTPWHRECFICTNCNKMLAGEKFTSRDEKPFCAECFGDLFAKKCIRCTKPITGLGGTKFISFEERHWHSDCFVCYKCNVSLVGRGFLTDNTDILCPDCGRA